MVNLAQGQGFPLIILEYLPKLWEEAIKPWSDRVLGIDRVPSTKPFPDQGR
jgi:hypothetical protein